MAERQVIIRQLIAARCRQLVEPHRLSTIPRHALAVVIAQAQGAGCLRLTSLRRFRVPVRRLSEILIDAIAVVAAVRQMRLRLGIVCKFAAIGKIRRIILRLAQTFGLFNRKSFHFMHGAARRQQPSLPSSFILSSERLFASLAIGDRKIW